MRSLRQDAAGFTLTELVMVIVIASILAAFAAARISTQSFDTEGFANRAAAMVRYAQRIAISQRRDVHVVVSSDKISLCYVITNCGTPSATSPVHEPPGTSAFSYSAPNGVTIALDSGTSFFFNALGKPDAGKTITVSGDVPKIITIAAETGYVQYVP